MTQNGDTVAVGDSFWDVSGYQRVVKRAESGVQMCGELSKLVLERSEIEKDYAKRLKSWAHKWRDNVDHGPEYGTNKLALMSIFLEAEELADVRLAIKDRLLGEVLVQLKDWKAANYHKQMVGSCKETKSFEEDFHKAQKPWAKKLAKLEKSKKDFHNACKALKTAITQENNARNSSDMSADQVKKLTDKVERCRHEVESTQSVYAASLKELNSYNPKYMEDMSEVFSRTQEFEARRLSFFKQLLFMYHSCVDASEITQIPDIYSRFHKSVEQSEVSADVKWWSDNYGATMTMAWPQYEEYTDEFRAISRKERGMGSAVVGGVSDGITLKSIQRTDDGQTVSSAPSASSTPPQTDSIPRQQSEELYDEWDDYQNIGSAAVAPAPDRQQSQPHAHRQMAENTAGTAATAPLMPTESLPSRNGGSQVDGRLPLMVRQTEATVVRALYDYEAQEADELSFKSGDVFVKVRERDEQGWCGGCIDGRMGLYPDNYVEIISH